MGDIIFVGSARCYHTMDWYRSAREVCRPRRVVIVTDLIASEGHPQLVGNDDEVILLNQLDWALLPGQSKLGNLWRNVVKACYFPLQALRLRRIVRSRPDSVVHAHSMYYMFLCWAARVRYLGTPQGSEVLVRPKRSKLYKGFAVKALTGATVVTVDSVNMRDRILQMTGKRSLIVQNGIDIPAIQAAVRTGQERSRVLSLRSIHPLYRIDLILAARANSRSQADLTFVYPSWEEGYRLTTFELLRPSDHDLGRMSSRTEMYRVMANSQLAISIPASDSSPRSVYEAIFCGCGVAVTYNPWIDVLPNCMKSRVFVIDLDDPVWFDRAIEWAGRVARTSYHPSETALELFDQRKSMATLAESCY